MCLRWRVQLHNLRIQAGVQRMCWPRGVTGLPCVFVITGFCFPQPFYSGKRKVILPSDAGTLRMLRLDPHTGPSAACGMIDRGSFSAVLTVRLCSSVFKKIWRADYILEPRFLLQYWAEECFPFGCGVCVDWSCGLLPHVNRLHYI